MKKEGKNALGFSKDALRRINPAHDFPTIDRDDLNGATGGFSLKCPDCEMSSKTNAADGGDLA